MRRKLPDPPPKALFESLTANTALIEKRRKQLEAWLVALVQMGPDMCNLTPVARFLETEAAAKKLADGEKREAMFTASMLASEESGGTQTAAAAAPTPTPSRANKVGLRLMLREQKHQQVRQLAANMQKRVAMARDDINDAFMCLRSETAAKELLASKVDDLEAAATTAKNAAARTQESAVAAEREKRTALQWEMENTLASARAAEGRATAAEQLRAAAETRAAESEAQAEAARSEASSAEARVQAARAEAAASLEQSHAEKKALAKEIKRLRKELSSAEEKCTSAATEAADLRRRVENMEGNERLELAREEKLLREVDALRTKLYDCSVERMVAEQNGDTEGGSGGGGGNPSHGDLIELLSLSDNRLAILTAEAGLLSSAASENDGRRQMLLSSTFGALLEDLVGLRKSCNSLLRNGVHGAATYANGGGGGGADGSAPALSSMGAAVLGSAVDTAKRVSLASLAGSLSFGGGGGGK